MERVLFYAQSRSGWCTMISTYDDIVKMNSGSGSVVTLSIKDIRKIIREYNKAKKNEHKEKKDDYCQSYIGDVQES